MSTQPNAMARSRAVLALEYPMSLGGYDTYAKAQKAVDYLSDHEFPVQNVLIVGTDLKQLERVTGRLTRQRVALGGLVSGAWLGLFVGLIFSLLDTGSGAGFVGVLLTVAFGAVFGLVWALIGYAAHAAATATSPRSCRWWRPSTRCWSSTSSPPRRVSCSTKMDPMAAAQAQVDAAREAERQRAAAEQPPRHRSRPPPDPPSLEGREARRIPQRLARAARGRRDVTPRHTLLA